MLAFPFPQRYKNSPYSVSSQRCTLGGLSGSTHHAALPIGDGSEKLYTSETKPIYLSNETYIPFKLNVYTYLGLPGRMQFNYLQITHRGMVKFQTNQRAHGLPTR